MRSQDLCSGLNNTMQSANPTLRSFYQTLRDTGIDYYFQKTTISGKQAPASLLQSHRPVVCAGCLVVLEQDPKQYTASQTKILDGMLKVLDLDKKDYCVAWMSPQGFSTQAILKYAPYSVLFLGATFSDLVMPAKAGIHVAYTYSPQALEADPTLKRSAFDTLLNLKKYLALLGSSVGVGSVPVPPPSLPATRVPPLPQGERVHGA